MILLLLAASLSLGQDLPQPTTAYQQTVSPEFEQTLSNLGKDVRELQEGRAQITGLPTFRNGIKFGDGTTQTTAGSSIPVTTNDITIGAWNSHTPTYTGFSSAPSGATTIYWARAGKSVLLMQGPSTAGTSNATSMTMTIPVAAKRSIDFLTAADVIDNGSRVDDTTYVRLTAGSTTMEVFKGGGGASFTSSGAKNVSAFFIIYEAQ